MCISDLLKQLNTNKEDLEFADVISLIDKGYDYSPCAFINGGIFNKAGCNVGSCKIFAFADANNLTQEQTLALFGRHYREDVLLDPDGHNHSNIRNFMRYGWRGVSFFGMVLTSSK